MYGYVYSITNKKNGKIYIGQSLRDNRKEEHLNDLKKNKHFNTQLQRSFNLYGENNFQFKIIEHANSQNELDELEDKYILISGYPNQDKCYNLKRGGSTGRLSEETKNKISSSKISLYHNKPEVRKQIGESIKSFYENHPEKAKERGEKVRQYHKEHPGIFAGKNNPMYGYSGELAPWYGKHHTEEYKKKMSNMFTGRKVSEEVKAKIKASKIGKQKGKDNPNFKDVDINKIIQLNQEGYSQREIGEILGICDFTVRRKAKENGYELKKIILKGDKHPFYNKSRKVPKIQGNNNVHAKYDWLCNISKVGYNKKVMFRSMRTKDNPKKCFQLKYNNKRVKGGFNFIDPLTPEIISNIIIESN